MRRGSVGVFAGDWAWVEVGGSRRQPVGFVGVLVDVWEGWAVFGCTRQVAEEILAEHHRDLGIERARLRSSGYSDDDAETRLVASTIRMWFDGDDIVVDERGLRADPTAVRRMSPEGGLYVVNGYVWPWMAVEAADCDRIVGVWLAL